MSCDIETIVIGGGVIGLAIGRALAEAGHELVILERHGLIGSETSSRNSEVIHAGIYYPPGSLRAQFCAEGKALLYEFACQNGIAHQACGKLLVATSDEELPKLKAIHANARASGVHDLTELSVEDVRAFEPAVRCTAALLSPSTGIIDSHGLMVALEGYLSQAGGSVVLHTDVQAITPAQNGLFRVDTLADGAPFSLTCKNLIISAGLGASALGATLHGAFKRNPDYRPPRLFPAKGHYFSLQTRSPFRHLVYPMPVKGGLGVHLTLDIAGRAKFGPDIEWVDQIDYAFDDSDGKRKARFATEIRRYWPDLPEEALVPDYTGIRPKVYPPDAPAADFMIHGVAEHGVDNLVALYGIESPGLTSSLALANHVARLLPSSAKG